ncbi:MAG TPA: beta-galactosidase GalA [Fimbriimonadaceae bacterium]|jgi:beta-galactosidase
MLRAVSILLIAALSSQIFAQSIREKKLLDFGWRFHFGNASDMNQDFGYGTGIGLGKAGEAAGAASPRFDDSTWRQLNIPHDWVAELPFVYNADGLHIAHGSKPISRAYPATTVGWYRRTFDIPDADKGKRLSIDFDGVFRDSQVWLNGHRLGRQESGYSSFSFDITDVVHYGNKNVLVVRVDASQYEGWFYEGAGIYRHVWLVKTAPVHVARYGTYVTSEVGKNDAHIKIETEVVNDSADPVNASLLSEIHDSSGKSVGQATSNNVKLAPWSSQVVAQNVHLSNPSLWSIETPNLYKLVSSVSSAGPSDVYETNFGVRTIAFDPDKGFLLNGKSVKIKGMCNHQDHAGVGSALPDRLQYFRIEKLKEFGCNAYRTSHNPPTPELLEACDKLGMIVMDENRLIGSSNYVLNQLDNQIRRDRNHPSVILWSIGNEENEENSPIGHSIGKTMVSLIHSLDPTRPTTFAGNNGNDYDGINSTVDVRGWNYMHLGNIDDYHKAHPTQPMVGSEEASAFATRGEYTTDPAKGLINAYDTTAADWGETAEAWWKFFDARPYLAGAFVWTGFDYRGEPTPNTWPNISSQFGVLDTCGFFKDTAYYYQAWWTKNDVLHILPHWNWSGKEGQNISVWCYSNQDEVELLLNGKSLGKKTVPHDSHVEWSVVYQPGTLEARGYRNGKVVKTEKVETTGGQTNLAIVPDRTTINADGEDVSVLTIKAVDAKGRLVHTAENNVAFQVTGGTILGVGNGNPVSHENDRFIPSDNTYGSNDWRSNPYFEENFQPILTDDFDVSEWRGANVNGDANQVGAKDSVVFRGFVDLPGMEAKSAVTLSFGKLGSNAFVYVNGAPAGHSIKGLGPYTFDVNALVRPGRNYLVVVIKNEGKEGGIGGGVTVRIVGPQPIWHRQLFHGLAQVIVEGTPNPGTIKITATSGGLKQAEASVETKAAPFRGY